ncbi:MAG: zinc-ribbon domain-containing protein [Methylohalobius sp.]|nr:zinc-ribbon domain-containing protein [Methylohalobius sp.]
MYTRCPQCHTVYRISAAALRCGRGEAICDRCSLIFGALENLGDNLEEALADHTSCFLELPQLKQGVAIAIAPTPSLPEDKEDKIEGTDGKPAPTPEPEPDLANDDSFVARSQTAIANRYWTAAAVVLALLLLAQMFAWAYEHVANVPSLYPAIAWACRWLSCKPPPFQDLAALKVVDRALYPAKGQSGYEFHLVLVNRAAYPQPFPLLKLSLTAMDGTLIAERVFKPEEYLRISTPGLMPSHQPLFIDLALASPKQPVGGFQFEFLK